VIHASRTVDSPETEARASERGRAVSGMNETKTRRIRHERAAEAQPRTQKTVTRERRAFGSIFTFSRRADKGLERGVGAAGSAASAGSLNPKQSNYRTVYIRYSHYICRIDSEQHVRISSAQCPLVLLFLNSIMGILLQWQRPLYHKRFFRKIPLTFVQIKQHK